MKEEIEIPQKYDEIIKKIAKKQGISYDEIVENAIRQFIERSPEDVK
jgi:DNA-directed RNA polymerase delta subunit